MMHRLWLLFTVHIRHSENLWVWSFHVRHRINWLVRIRIIHAHMTMAIIMSKRSLRFFRLIRLHLLRFKLFLRSRFLIFLLALFLLVLFETSLFSLRPFLPRFLPLFLLLFEEGIALISRCISIFIHGVKGHVIIRIVSSLITSPNHGGTNGIN